MIRASRMMLSYAGAIAVVALATLVRAGLEPVLGEHMPYPTYFVAVFVSAWLWGPGPALLAIVLGSLLVDFLFLPPRGRFGLIEPSHGVGVAIFAIGSAVAIALSASARRAQGRAQQRERRNRLLAESGETLASSVDLTGALHLVAGGTVPDLADWCVIRTLDDEEIIRKLICVHRDPARVALMEEMYRRYPPTSDQPQGPHHAMRTGRSDFIPEVDEADIDRYGRDADHARLMRAIGLRSYLCAPLLARGRTLGTLSLGLGDSGRRFSTDDLVLAEDLARRVALAIDNARLLEEAQRSRQRFEFLAEASATLASSLDFEDTLAAVARLAVPGVADWCAVDMAEPDGSLRRLAVAHDDPAKVEWAHELHRRYPPDPESPGGAFAILRHGRSEMVSEVDDAMVESAARDPEHLEILRAVGFRSYIGVPLATRDRVLGVLTLVTTDESGYTFGPDDLALAEELARRAAVAVDNARLYRDAEAARRRSEEIRALLETLMGSAPVGLSFVDRGLRYVRVNDALARLDGVPRELMLGRTIREVVPDLAPRIEPNYARVLETGQPYVGVEVSGETRAYPGELRIWHVDYYPVRIAGGELLGVGAVVVDVTEKKRAEQDLRQARDAAEAANQAKDRFLAVLSHELRNPLSPILAGVTEALESPEIPESLRPVLEMTRRNVALEARLIDDLLDVTRIAHGKLTLDREPTAPLEVVRQALEICRPEAEDRRLELVTDLEECRPPTFVDADPARLQQIAWNLIKNAIKFTPPGGRVIVRCHTLADPDANADPDADRGASRWFLEVTDTGIGIDPAALDRIFVPMEQGDPAVTRQFGGLGLGLAISRSLAEAHGGALRATSPGRNQGATFILQLPTCPAPSPAAPDGNGRGEAEVPAGLRILLVEDNADTLHILARLLRARGHQVIAAGAVADALAATDGRPLDLVISDIGLPDGSGLDLMRTIHDRCGVRGIALSGFGMDHDLRRSAEAGFAAHLTKPVDFPKLQAAIRRALADPEAVGSGPSAMYSGQKAERPRSDPTPEESPR